MAAKTGTYTLIASASGTGSSGTITFSSIPATYTDLVLVSVLDTTANTDSIVMRYNNDTGSNYSTTFLYGTGSVVESKRLTGDTKIYWEWNGIGSQTTPIIPYIVHIQDYANTNTNKTNITRDSNASVAVGASVGLWRSTAAINRVDVIALTGNFITGSTFKLYGIEAGNL